MGGRKHRTRFARLTLAWVGRTNREAEAGEEWLWLEPRDPAGDGQSWERRRGEQSHRLGVSLRGRVRAGSSQQGFGSWPGL